jgi:hypothetical protein
MLTGSVALESGYSWSTVTNNAGTLRIATGGSLVKHDPTQAAGTLTADRQLDGCGGSGDGGLTLTMLTSATVPVSVRAARYPAVVIAVLRHTVRRSA